MELDEKHPYTFCLVLNILLLYILQSLNYFYCIRRDIKMFFIYEKSFFELN